MAPHDEEDDPAVYRTSGHKNNASGTKSPTNGSANGAIGNESDGHALGKGPGPFPVDETEDEEEEEEDSTLLTVQPGFNRLLMVLRDERVMRFVKYVSAAAEGSRWDVCGEYEIGMVEEEEDS